MTDHLLTTRAVAEYLALSPETVLRRLQSGDLPGIRLGWNVLRLRERDVEAWLERCAEPRSTYADGRERAGAR